MPLDAAVYVAAGLCKHSLSLHQYNVAPSLTKLTENTYSTFYTVHQSGAYVYSTVIISSM